MCLFLRKFKPDFIVFNFSFFLRAFCVLKQPLRADSPAKLTSELDGLRVLTATRNEFIFRVPDAVVEVFSIGSTTVGSAIFCVFRCGGFVCCTFDVYIFNSVMIYFHTFGGSSPTIRPQPCFETQQNNTMTGVRKLRVLCS